MTIAWASRSCFYFNYSFILNQIGYLIFFLFYLVFLVLFIWEVVLYRQNTSLKHSDTTFVVISSCSGHMQDFLNCSPLPLDIIDDLFINWIVEYRLCILSTRLWAHTLAFHRLLMLCNWSVFCVFEFFLSLLLFNWDHTWFNSVNFLRMNPLGWLFKVKVVLNLYEFCAFIQNTFLIVYCYFIPSCR